MNLHDDLAARIPALTVYDGEPPATPPGRYVCLYYDTGLESERRICAPSAHIRVDVSAVCVARTRPGVRDAVTIVRTALNRCQPFGADSAMVEESSGPLVTEGPAGDVRMSATLVFTVRIRRNQL
ncbi:MULTISPECIES: hypothetical protein [Bacillati]|uniref:hypothetical protein n=1 Tax=Bacillati TaxID=1783272 RepID=UPI003F8C9700